MKSELETRAFLKDASDLQNRLRNIAALEQLEDLGIHTHPITKALDPTKGDVIAQEAHDLRSGGENPPTTPR